MSMLASDPFSADGALGAGDVKHLMIPGPCRLDPDEQEVLGRSIQPHYGERWVPRFRRVIDDLTALLGARHTYLLPGSGSAGLDAALFNLFEPGQRVVVVDSGYFGGRLMTMARAHGLDVRIAPCVPGQPVDPERVGELLPACDGVLVTQVESATGVRHPVEQLAALAHDAGAVILVDAIAAAGGERIHMTRMGLDALVTASQKGLGGAPGLAIVALTARGKLRVESRSCRPPTWYFDLANWDRASEECPGLEPTPVTMPTTLVEVLASSVRRMCSVGIDTWIEARERLAGECRAGIRRLGLRLSARDEWAANLLVVVTDPRADAIRAQLASNAGIMVGGGMTPFEDNTFRIGLVGRAGTGSMVSMVLDEIREVLR
jgi:alanine-glyoxylate transaminase/serine-glyoxylate transaminase/serine-pyruvate transaminase